MLTLILILLLGIYTIRVFTNNSGDLSIQQLPTKLSEKIDKLWKIAQLSLKEKKYLRAEKALLTILQNDEKNAAAYNRLGILYAKQRQFNDAIECFEIAQSLEPSASSLHNVGLIYFETEQFDKAAIAFEQAIEMESDLSARHIAYAKVQEKLGNNKKMIAALEKAVDLEPHPQSLKILAEAYDRNGEDDLAKAIRAKLERLATPKKASSTPVKQPRKVML